MPRTDDETALYNLAQFIGCLLTIVVAAIFGLGVIVGAALF